MNKRLSRRFLCAELVQARWKDKAGRLRRTVAHLEDISRCGACLQLEDAVPVDTPLVLCFDKAELPGTVRYCLYRDWSYFLGVAFTEGTQWSRLRHQPRHMLDPRELLLRASRRARAAVSRPPQA